MRKPTFLYVLAVLCIPTVLPAQGVISFTGGVVGNSEVNLLFTAGDVVSGSFQNSNVSLIAGFGNGSFGVLTANEETGGLLPNEFKLSQNYPNPFNPATNINYQLPQSAQVRLEVFNSIGAIVAVLVDEQKAAGFYTQRFQANNLASGVYFYRLMADNKLISTQKMLLIK